MHSSNLPLARDLVLVGGGHTHALFLRAWGMNPLPGVRVTLIDPAPAAAYSGMLPGFVAGHYSRDELDIDLVRLARFAGARFVNRAVTTFNPTDKTVTPRDASPIGYDVVSFDIGISTSLPGLDGFAENAVAAKPLAGFADAWQDFLTEAHGRHAVVIGGGVAGCEFAMAMAHATRAHGTTVTIVERDTVGQGLGEVGKRLLRSALHRAGVAVREKCTPASITPDSIRMEDGSVLRADFVTGAAGARPYGWLQGSGLVDKGGYLAIDPYLRTTDRTVFAVGDCAEMRQTPRPKAGVFAVRQAPVLDHNLRATLAGTGGLRRFHPQSDYLKLISLGEKSALLDRHGLAAKGAMLWQWKDRIDRRFMRRLNDLPRPAPPVLPWPRAAGTREALGAKPMCGGCGSKIGAAALRRALDTGGGLGDDAAVLGAGTQHQVISTDHLRALSEDPALMGRLAAVHALGDIWAMGAAPQAATASIILPRLSEILAERTLREIMEAAREVFEQAGARIVGGHSTIGSELTVGFTVTGLCDNAPIMMNGARPGDALILTKPIGSGVVMAAEMEYRADGADVMRTLEIMCQPQGQAARTLARAHAMTDVTGFGLAGHAAAIGEASGCGIELAVGAVPHMPGALSLARRGTRSSLYAQNRGAFPGLPDRTPAEALMFDPQTGGGLLAAVDGDPADLLHRLERDGYTAAIIGRVTDEVGQISFV